MASPRYITILTHGEMANLKKLLQLVATGQAVTPWNEAAEKLLKRAEDTPSTDVILLLTISEARSLGKSMEHTMVEDDGRAIYDTPPKLNAARRAAKKLRGAIQAKFQGRCG